MSFLKLVSTPKIVLCILSSLVGLLISAVCFMFIKITELEKMVIRNEEALSVLLKKIEFKTQEILVPNIPNSISNVELIGDTTANSLDGLALFLTVILVWVFFFSQSQCPPELPEKLIPFIKDTEPALEAKRAYEANNVLFQKNLDLQSKITELSEIVESLSVSPSLNTGLTVADSTDIITEVLPVVDIVHQGVQFYSYIY